jgi:hypothetical protein
LIPEDLQEDVNGRTVNGVAPGFADFEPRGGYIQASYFIVPKKLQGSARGVFLSDAA